MTCKNDKISPSIDYTYWLYNKQVKNKNAVVLILKCVVVLSLLSLQNTMSRSDDVALGDVSVCLQLSGYSKMAVDITLLFKASVKTVKTRNKAMGIGFDSTKDEIFKRSKTKHGFSPKAKEVVSSVEGFKLLDR